MLSATFIRIQLSAKRDGNQDVRQVLEQAGFLVAHDSSDANEAVDPARCNLIVVDGSDKAESALQKCRDLRRQFGEHFVPILFISSDHSPTTRLASLESGADAYLLRPFDPSELLAHVQALIRIKDRQDRLAEKTEEVHRVNKRLQAAYQQIDQELELASRIQASFLPHTLPQVPEVRFAVYYRRCGRVGGDFYDVFRLDERHIGFYVADAMGHGVPASLLTIFVKKGIKTKEIFGNDYRLVPPGEVLQKLNRDLIDQALSDHPFITMAYALLNVADGSLQWSRAGHPFPIYIPQDGPPQLWQSQGTLLGVFDTTYANQRRQLRPGDRLLLYTDGVDAAAYENQPKGTESLLACLNRHRATTIDELVTTVSTTLFNEQRIKDDLTLLGMERKNRDVS